MFDISGYGLGITVVAASSFPMGFQLSQFADDVDPLVIEPLEPSDYEKLYDGSIFIYNKTAPVLVSLSVIPNSDDDTNLKVLLQSQGTTPQLLPIPQVTNIVIKYQSGFVIMSEGGILSGPIADSIGAQYRKKSNTYKFVFGSFAGSQSTLQGIATIAQNVISLL